MGPDTLAFIACCMCTFIDMMGARRASHLLDDLVPLFLPPADHLVDRQGCAHLETVRMSMATLRPDRAETAGWSQPQHTIARSWRFNGRLTFGNVGCHAVRRTRNACHQIAMQASECAVRFSCRMADRL